MPKWQNAKCTLWVHTWQHQATCYSSAGDQFLFAIPRHGAHKGHLSPVFCGNCLQNTSITHKNARVFHRHACCMLLETSYAWHVIACYKLHSAGTSTRTTSGMFSTTCIHVRALGWYISGSCCCVSGVEVLWSATAVACLCSSSTHTYGHCIYASYLSQVLTYTPVALSQG